MKANKGSYLITGSSFWTMTPAGGHVPYGFTTWSTYVFSVYGTGDFDDGNVSGASGLRPVVNLKSSITITGSGTQTDPYVVS